MESSLEESAPGEVIAEFQPVSFQIVESGTKRRKTSLIDSLGFSYNVHSRRPCATYWQCTVRPKGNPCKASVTERNGVFRSGQQSHNHTVEMGAATAAKIVSQVKSKALEDKFKPASAIVDEVTINFFYLSVTKEDDDSYIFKKFPRRKKQNPIDYCDHQKSLRSQAPSLRQFCMFLSIQ